MLHAAAMLIGLWLIWLLLAPAPLSAESAAAGALAAFVSVLIASRFAQLSHAFSHAVQLALLAIGRAGAVLRGALATIRAALAADVTLRPALVRVKLRPSSELARAALTDMISAAPGSLVVDADGDGLLAHVLDEHAIDADDLGRFETRVLNALDGRRA